MFKNLVTLFVLTSFVCVAAQNQSLDNALAIKELQALCADDLAENILDEAVEEGKATVQSADKKRLVAMIAGSAAVASFALYALSKASCFKKYAGINRFPHEVDQRPYTNLAPQLLSEGLRVSGGARNLISKKKPTDSSARASVRIAHARLESDTTSDD